MTIVLDSKEKIFTLKENDIVSIPHFPKIEFLVESNFDDRIYLTTTDSKVAEYNTGYSTSKRYSNYIKHFRKYDELEDFTPAVMTRDEMWEQIESKKGFVG